MTTEISVIGIFALLFMGLVMGLMIGAFISDSMWKQAIKGVMGPGWEKKVERRKNGWDEDRDLPMGRKR